MTKENLIKDFKNIGISEGATVLVHTALSAVGHIEGGAQILIDALKEIVTESGTIVMPAFKGTGITAEIFKNSEDVINSNHPCANYACWGEKALEIAGKIDFSDEGLSFENGKNSPLGRLYDNNAWILMIGTDYSSCSALHLAENISKWPGKKIIEEKMSVSGEGDFVIHDVAYQPEDFVLLGTALENRFWGDEEVIRFGKIGNAQAKYINMKLLVDYAADWMSKNR